LQDVGVETWIFSPLRGRKTPGPRNLGNHRKPAVADGERLWAGGRNLAAEYFMGNNGIAPWLDLSFELAGPTAVSAALQFEADWKAAGGEPAEAIPVSEPEYPDGLSQFLPSGPDQMEDTVHALLIDACFQAKQRMV